MKRYFWKALAIAALPSLLVAQSLTEFEKKVTEFTLANGLHFIVVERHNAPVVSFHSYVDVGSVDDPKGETGMAHMFEHMAFKGTSTIGTKNYPAEKAAIEEVERVYDQLQNEQNKYLHADKQKIAQYEKQLQAAMEKANSYVEPNLYTRIIEENGGVGLNASTSLDSTNYFYNFPSNRIELWFLLESQRFLDPVFREFYKERDVVREERRMRVESDPQGKLMENFIASSFAAHPYRNMPGGWASDIENYRLTEAVQFYKKYYIPSNITIGIVGDVNPAEAKRLAEKYFGLIPNGARSQRVRTVEPVQEGERRVEVESESQPIEMIGYKRPDQNSDDDAALGVIGEILSQGRMGLIYKKLVRDEKLALAAGAYPMFPGGKYPNLFLVYLVPNMGKTLDENEKAVFEILEKLKTEKVDDETLKRVKTNIRADLIRKLDSNAGLAAELTANYVAYGDWRRLFTELAAVDKVTADDVQRVAKKYLIPEARTVARLVAPPASSKPQTSKQGGE